MPLTRVPRKEKECTFWGVRANHLSNREGGLFLGKAAPHENIKKKSTSAYTSEEKKKHDIDLLETPLKTLN